MYTPAQFKEKDSSVVKDFIRQHPFAVVCGCNVAGQPVATHIPLLIEERDNALFLLGHFMRKTDHHLAFEQNPETLAIFNGPHSYISASWYANHQTASTWNYMTVHARGKMKLLDTEALYNILVRTTAFFENDPHSPALVEKMPEAYISSMAKAIIGFEIEVTELDNVFKLSQNRNAADHSNIIEQLKLQDNADALSVAHEMGKRKKME